MRLSVAVLSLIPALVAASPVTKRSEDILLAFYHDDPSLPVPDIFNIPAKYINEMTAVTPIGRIFDNVGIQSIDDDVRKAAPLYKSVAIMTSPSIAYVECAVEATGINTKSPNLWGQAFVTNEDNVTSNAKWKYFNINESDGKKYRFWDFDVSQGVEAVTCSYQKGFAWPQVHPWAGDATTPGMDGPLSN